MAKTLGRFSIELLDTQQFSFDKYPNKKTEYGVIEIYRIRKNLK